MARIKHIALSTDDPVKTAAFYKEAFGLTELDREPKGTGAKAVWLTDGYIWVAILKHGSDYARKTATPGFDHLGFYVDNLQEARKAVEGAPGHGKEVSRDPKRMPQYIAPDGIEVEFRVSGDHWDPMIKAKAKLHKLILA